MQEVTFHPHINQHSLAMMQERRAGNGSASFLNRLEADLHGRKMRLQVGTTKPPLPCKKRKEKEELVLFSVHNGNLPRRQPGAHCHVFKGLVQDCMKSAWSSRSPGACAVQRWCIVASESDSDWECNICAGEISQLEISQLKAQERPFSALLAVYSGREPWLRLRCMLSSLGLDACRVLWHSSCRLY